MCLRTFIPLMWRVTIWGAPDCAWSSAALLLEAMLSARVDSDSISVMSVEVLCSKSG